MDKVFITEYDCQGTTYILSEPIELVISKEKHVFCVDNEKLQLFGCGSTLVEAVADFRNLFEYYLEYYLTISPDLLSKNEIFHKTVYDYIANTSCAKI